MRRIWTRTAVLLGIFLLAVCGFFLLAPEEGTISETQEMSEAAFPVLFFTWSGEDINASYGYAQQMDVSTIRDTVTPVASDLTIPVTVEAYDYEVTAFSFTVYSSDGSEALEEHAASEAETSDGTAVFSLVLDAEIEEEAVLEITLYTSDDTQLYYYTRLKMQGSTPLTLALSFARTFHEETLNDSDGSSLSAYLETASGGDADGLSHVTIASSLSLVMWSDLEPYLASDLLLDIAELNDSYQAFTMTYLVSSDVTGATYYIEEYFRIRIVNSQPYLLDYDRTMEQIFTAGETAVSDDALQLGIRSADLTYVSDDAGTMTSFVQAGSLWEYDAGDGSLIYVFGFMDIDESGAADVDHRDWNMEYEITICSMDESGNLYFLVTGYHSRGTHEGENGISLYYYDAINETVEEKIFLASDCSYQVLKEETGTLAYVNASGALCLMCGGSLYLIDLDSGETSLLVEDPASDFFAVSESGRYAAYLASGGSDSASVLYVIDLDTGEITEIFGNGGYVRPLGYLGENLVYGIASPEDVVTDEAGNVTFAMNTLVILDTDLSVVKEYDEGSYYVTEAEITDGAVRLTRVTKSGDGYEDAGDDTIVDYDSLDSNAAVQESGSQDGTQEEQVLLRMSVSAAEEISLIIPQAQTADCTKTALPETALSGSSWRVYRKQDVILISDSLGGAIAEAYEIAGIVTDDTGRLVWRRNNDSSGSLSEEVIAEACALTAAAQTDLTGCTLEEVLYYTAQDLAAWAVLNGTAYLILDYTSTAVTLYNPQSDATDTYSQSELETRLETAGNVFYVWIP